MRRRPNNRARKGMRRERALGGVYALVIGLGFVLGGGCDGRRSPRIEPGFGHESSIPAPSEPKPKPALAESASEISAVAPPPTEPPASVVAPIVPPGPAQAGSCPEMMADEIGLMVSPRRPEAGQPLRIVVASLADEAMLAVRLEDSSGQPIDASIVHRSGVPAATIVRLIGPAAGTTINLRVGRAGEGLLCETITLRRDVDHKVRSALDDGVWPIRRTWNAAEEALYSAWVRELFHAPRGEDLAWSALYQVTGDAERNLLFNHFDWGEDSMPKKGGLLLRPDCADTPYFLRAYFAWKRGLPFGFRQCSRGGGGRAPSCGSLHTVIGPPEHPPEARLPGELGAVQRFFRRTLAWGVHTGNGRTSFDNDLSDFYPLTLTRRSLRPGVIYADPYGHIFVVAEMMATDAGEPGVLYAIDGQPDGSITRKRFWEGNFLWNPDPALGGSGFKGIRPPMIHGGGPTRTITTPSNETLASMDGYRDVGDEQSRLDASAFYDRMDALITPGVRDPFVAQQEAVKALYESAKVRVTSVDNGVAYIEGHGTPIAMPDGFSIFETTGAWENYSTPARDLRLLIALDIVTGFGAKVARNPSAWGVSEAELAAVQDQLAVQRQLQLNDRALSFTYTRSDGTPWTLTLADLVTRATDLESAYNPNDCPEVRWGAPLGSDERSPCRRRAPSDQQRKMAAYRLWFHQRRRPARGDTGPAVKAP